MSLPEQTITPLFGEIIIQNIAKDIVQSRSLLDFPQTLPKDFCSLMNSLIQSPDKDSFLSTLFENVSSASDVTGNAMLIGINSHVFYKHYGEEGFSSKTDFEYVMRVGKRLNDSSVWIHIQDDDIEPSVTLAIGATPTADNQISVDMKLEHGIIVESKNFLPFTV